MTNSFFPAAQRVVRNPIVRWISGVVLALLTAALTTGVWPFFKGWVVTRADVETVQKQDARITKIEKSLSVDYERLDSAKSDDTGALTDGEQLEWSLIRIKRLQLRLVASTRARLGMEARLRFASPKSDQAKRAEVSVMAKFDDLMFKGESIDDAEKKALETIYGAPR